MRSNDTDTEAFIRAYITCALWSSVEDDEPMDGAYGRDDLSTEALGSMREDCLDFIEAQRDDLECLDAVQCGHDFWLTRNGHGAGFWDRGYGALGERLTEAAKVYGSQDLYSGDDGWLYVA